MIKTDVGQSTIYLYLEYIIKLAFGFTISALITRQLGPVDSGKFSFVISFSTLFMPLYLMGINEYSVQDLVKSPEKENDILGTTFCLKTLGSFIAIVLTCTALLILKISKELQLLIVLNSIFLSFKSFDVIDNWYLAKIKSKNISIARIITLLITSSLKLFLWVKNESWQSFVIISLLEPVLYAFTYVFIFKKNNIRIFDWKFDKKMARSYFKKSVGFLSLTVISTLLFKIDQIFIEKNMSSETLGHYLAAVKLIEIWQFAPMILISVLFPKLVATFERSEDFLKSKRVFYSFIIIPSFVFCICVSIIARPLVILLYGNSFHEAGDFLMYYNWVVPFLYFWWARMRISIILNEIKVEIIVSLVAIAIMILCLFTLNQFLGKYITIVSILISIILSNLIMAILNGHIRSSLKDFFFAFNLKNLLKPNFKTE